MQRYSIFDYALITELVAFCIWPLGAAIAGTLWAIGFKLHLVGRVFRKRRARHANLTHNLWSIEFLSTVFVGVVLSSLTKVKDRVYVKRRKQNTPPSPVKELRRISNPDLAQGVIVWIPGTWHERTRSSAQRLIESISVAFPNHHIFSFDWHAINQQKWRIIAATILAREIAKLQANGGDLPMLLVGHSHGGSVAWMTAQRLPAATNVRVITLATPFVELGTTRSLIGSECTPQSGQVVAARRALLQALISFPILAPIAVFVAWSFWSDGIGTAYSQPARTIVTALVDLLAALAILLPLWHFQPRWREFAVRTIAENAFIPHHAISLRSIRTVNDSLLNAIVWIDEYFRAWFSGRLLTERVNRRVISSFEGRKLLNSAAALGMLLVPPLVFFGLVGAIEIVHSATTDSIGLLTLVVSLLLYTAGVYFVIRESIIWWLFWRGTIAFIETVIGFWAHLLTAAQAFLAGIPIMALDADFLRVSDQASGHSIEHAKTSAVTELVFTTQRHSQMLNEPEVISATLRALREEVP